MKRKPFAKVLIGLALVALMATDGLAQDEARRGSRGAFGGGMTGRGGDPTMGLLRIEEVKAELEITDEQQAALNKLAAQSRPDRGPREGRNFRDMSAEDRQAFVEQMQKELAQRAQELKEKLEEVLLPGQMERLEQLAMQVRGANAISDPIIRERLNVSDEQIAKLAELRESTQQTMRTKMRELFQSGDREAMRDAFGKLRKEAEENLIDVLTDEQRSEFEAMQGEPFEFPENALGRGRGRRGGERGLGRRRGRSESNEE